MSEQEAYGTILCIALFYVGLELRRFGRDGDASAV